MLARKRAFLLACVLCAGTAFATERNEGTAPAEDEFGIVADKTIPGAETIFADAVASGGEESRPGGENQPNDSQS